VLVQLDRAKHAVLAAAAELAGDRPANTGDLLIAVLATRYDPAAKVMRSLGLTTETLNHVRPDTTESGPVVLPSGPPVTSTLAHAITDAQLDGSPVPVSPTRLLVATLTNPRCDAARLLLAARVPPWRVLAGLRARQRQESVAPDQHNVHLEPSTPGPATVVSRSPRRLSLALFGLVGFPSLTALCGLVGLRTATGTDAIPIVVAVPVLVALAFVLGRVRAGWCSRIVTVLLAGLFLITGCGALDARAPAGQVIGSLATLGVVFLLGVGWCVRSGLRRRLRAAIYS
jgi:hypothetical protein